MLKRNFPSGVYATFFIFALLMCSTCVIQGLLVLYITTKFLVKDAAAYSIYAAYSSSIYAASLFGGYVGQRYLRSHIAVMTGLSLCVLGLAAITFAHKSALLAGLSCFALGSGLVYPNVYNLLGKLYQQDSLGRSSGFTIAYTGMNFGSLFGFIVGGYLEKYISFHSAFVFALIFVMLGLLLFILRYKNFPIEAITTQKQRKEVCFGFAWLVLVLPLLFILLHFDTLFRMLVIIAGVGITLAILIAGFRSKKTDPKLAKGLLLFCTLALFSVIFWALYCLQPTALITFLDRNVARDVLGHVIPASSIMSFNPIYMLILGPLLSAFWLWQDKRGKIITDMMKFTIALMILGFSMLSISLGILFADHAGYVSLFYIAIFFLLLSVAEMVIAPAGYAAVGKLIPSAHHGFMLGVWQLMIGVGVAISGEVAKWSTKHNFDVALPLQTDASYLKFFTILGIIALIFSGFSLLMAKKKVALTAQAGMVAYEE